jgi:allophanate hydrolase
MPEPTPALPRAAQRAGRGVADWLGAVRGGADVASALDALRGEAAAAAGHHVWIHRCPDDAWAAQQARLASRLAESADRNELLQRYPLLGVPFAVKDNIDIAGEPTTAACPKFAHVAERSATVVQRLLDAGAVWVGKTNLDQFATGLVGTRSPYGRPASVADPRRISGGSSSGSAVAVARGLVAFALGTDTAGSGRVPAGFNGVVGLKPTPGRVSTAGVLPACRTLDCVSVFAHDVDDAAHVLAVIEGADPLDSYSSRVTGPARLAERLRIGVPRSPRWFGDAGYAAAWAAALAHTEALGHRLVPIDFALLDAVAALLYDGPWVAERHAVVRELLRSNPEALDSTVRRVVSRAIGMSATEAFEGGYRLRSLQASLARLWEQVDVLLVPTAPGHPTFAEVDADPLATNAVLGTYTNFVNLLGWCALAVPAGLADHGLPFGVTFIGRGGHDAALLPLARHWLGAAPPVLQLRPPASAKTLPLAVVGAHLSGLPLNRQLVERGATLVGATSTAAAYRLYALPGTTPPKPGLQRVASGGVAVAVEVWAMPEAAVGSFLAEIPPPLGLGSIELADGRHVHGFLCEAHALAGAADISRFGGWRAYLASLSSSTRP